MNDYRVDFHIETWKNYGICHWSGKSLGNVVCLWCATAVAMVTNYTK